MNRNARSAALIFVAIVIAGQLVDAMLGNFSW